MADLDVTEILSDPDFTSTFDVERNDGGTVTRIAGCVGVITESSRLLRTEAGDRRVGELRIRTKQRLIDRRASLAPDVVIAKGERWLVTWVESYDNWGSGFYKARCEPLALGGSNLPAGDPFDG